jgi:hypothetical protein
LIVRVGALAAFLKCSGRPAKCRPPRLRRWPFGAQLRDFEPYRQHRAEVRAARKEMCAVTEVDSPSRPEPSSAENVSSRIILLDSARLVPLMIKYRVGVHVKQSYDVAGAGRGLL